MRRRAFVESPPPLFPFPPLSLQLTASIAAEEGRHELAYQKIIEAVLEVSDWKGGGGGDCFVGPSLRVARVCGLSCVCLVAFLGLSVIILSVFYFYHVSFGDGRRFLNITPPPLLPFPFRAQRDPDGGLMAFESMMRKQITMPAHLMDDNQHGVLNTGRNLFEDFSIVAERTGKLELFIN